MTRAVAHLFWPAFWVFLADQASKYIVVHMMELRTLGQIDVLPPFLQFHMAWNRGINFGLFTSDGDMGRWVLIAIALVISVAVITWTLRTKPGRWATLSAGVLVGGALANVVDRVLYGAVADFLNMSCCGINNPYAFNIADIAIFVGAIGLVLFEPGKARKKGA